MHGYTHRKVAATNSLEAKYCHLSTGHRINFQAQLFKKLFQLDHPHNLKKNKNRLETCRSKSNLIANSIGDKKER